MKEQNTSLIIRCGILGTVLLMTTLVAACGSTINTHGQVIDDRAIGYVRPGNSTQTDVRRLLGSPSTTGTFNAQRWYYMMETTESTALAPNQLDKRQLIIVEFDDKGVVSQVLTKNEDDGREIPFSTAETPTQGQSMGIMDQMIDNVGRGF